MEDKLITHLLLEMVVVLEWFIVVVVAVVMGMGMTDLVLL